MSSDGTGEGALYVLTAAAEAEITSFLIIKGMIERHMIKLRIAAIVRRRIRGLRESFPETTADIWNMTHMPPKEVRAHRYGSRL